jgi:hypothetical protein
MEYNMFGNQHIFQYIFDSRIAFNADKADNILVIFCSQIKGEDNAMNIVSTRITVDDNVFGLRNILG